MSVINPLDPASRSALIVAGFLLVVAIIGKIAAGWSFIIDKPTNRLVVGLGMMPRGEVGLIFLGLGTSAGLLTPSLEAAILLMVIGTTFLAPVLLRVVLKDKPPSGIWPIRGIGVTPLSISAASLNSKTDKGVTISKAKRGDGS